MLSHSTQRSEHSKTEIPDKLYFRIGDVAKLCDVPAYVLRFWESEFPHLRPNKSGTGQRLYRKRDVEMALRIKRLLYDEGYTIAGARQAFQAEIRRKGGQPDLPFQQQNAERAEARLHTVRTELKEILNLLSLPVAAPREKRSARPAARKPELFESSSPRE